jgi:hypothetical protein
MNQVHPRLRAILVTIGALAALSSAVDCSSSGDSSAMAPLGKGGQGYDASGGASDTGVCTEGEYVCEGAIAHKCGGDVVEDCSSAGKVCAAGLGCVVCTPSSQSCNASDGSARYCTADGSRQIEFECDPLQGMQCEADGCVGACAPQKIGWTHVGCDFFPTVTSNSAWKAWFRFGVVVTNTTDSDANITITRGAEAIAAGVVGKSGHATFELEWVDELKGPDADDNGAVLPPTAGMIAKQGAYRLRSDQPIAVHQYSTLSSENHDGVQTGCPDPFQLSRCLSLSNDASLLVPASSMLNDYTIAGWHAWRLDTQPAMAMPDLIAVTAVHDDTEVKLVTGAQTVTASLPLASEEDAAAPTLGPNQEATFLLMRGDVLQLFTDSASGKNQWSGSTISASAPVQVLSGAPCASIPDDTIACDHLEELVPPTELAGRNYLVTTPSTPKGATRHIVRVLGLEDATDLTFEPPEAHGSATLAKNEVLQIDTSVDFQVSSSKPFLVMQFMIGHGGGTTPMAGEGVGDGDPSQSLTVPRSRHLKSYFFSTPSGFGDIKLNVVAANGASVKLNGVLLDAKEFTPIGSSGFSVARVPLEPDTRYELRGDQPVGGQLYGYGAFTSFMAPLGLDLRPASIP